MVVWRFSRVFWALFFISSSFYHRYLLSVSVSGNISKCFYTRYLEKVDFAIFCHLRSAVQNSRVLYANHSGIYLYFVILLCGDIHQNPGPAVFNCGVCGLNVSNADKAICCDMCEKWVHVTCDPYISESEYVTGFGKTCIIHTSNFSTLVAHKI